MWIGHRKEIQKLTLGALALRRSESTWDWITYLLITGGWSNTKQFTFNWINRVKRIISALNYQMSKPLLPFKSLSWNVNNETLLVWRLANLARSTPKSICNMTARLPVPLASHFITFLFRHTQLFDVLLGLLPVEEFPRRHHRDGKFLTGSNQM